MCVKCVCASDRHGRKGLGLEAVVGPRSGGLVVWWTRQGLLVIWEPEVQAGRASSGEGGGNRSRAVWSVGERANVVPAKCSCSLRTLEPTKKLTRVLSMLALRL